MKVIVLSGFLGSGKTTTLLQLARAIVDHDGGAHKVPVAIIENEIGEISVDGHLLGDYTVKELFGGCICCTLSAGLASAVRQLHQEFDPQFVVIEATGMAYPDKVATVIKQYIQEAEEVRTIVLVDAERFDDLMENMDLFITGQICCGDVIFLNKVDRVPASDVGRIAEAIRQIVPDAQVLPVCAKEGIAGRTMETIFA